MKNLSYFKGRSTVRQYDGRPLPPEDIKEMLEAAMHAPNTGNMQWYSVVVTTDEAGKAALSPAHFGQKSVTTAAAVLTFARTCGVLSSGAA